MARMSRNDGIGHSQKTLRNDPGNFKTVEGLVPHLAKNPLQSLLYTLRSQSTKEHHLYFCRHEKQVPPRAMDLAIKGQTIERLDQPPAARIALTLRHEKSSR